MRRVKGGCPNPTNPFPGSASDKHYMKFVRPPIQSRYVHAANPSAVIHSCILVKPSGSVMRKAGQVGRPGEFKHVVRE